MQPITRAMILAAGFGTRLLPYTQTVPKPMLEVCGKPTIQWIVEALAGAGIHDIVVNLSYLPEQVEAYFGDGERFGVAMHYSFEETALGTAGGMKRASRYLTEPFVLWFGDVLSTADLHALMAFHQKADSRPHLTMLVCEVNNPTECGIIQLDEAGRIVRMLEKPQPEQVFSKLANGGILVIDPELLDVIPAESFADIGHDMIPSLIAGGVPLYGWEMPSTQYLIDMGTPEKYVRAQTEWQAALDA